MKINAHNRLRNPVFANLQEDTDAMSWLENLPNRLGTLSFPNKNTGLIKGKYATLQLTKENRGYSIFYRHKDGRLAMVLDVSAPTIDALVKTFISDLSKEIAKHEDEENKMYKDLQEYKYAIRHARRAFF